MGSFRARIWWAKLDVRRRYRYFWALPERVLGCSRAFMWTCPKCKEEIGDEFDSCWKCAGTVLAASATQKAKKPLEQFEHICILIAILPGVLFFTRGRA